MDIKERRIREEEKDRIIRDIDIKLEEGVFEDYNKQEVIDEIITIIKNI